MPTEYGTLQAALDAAQPGQIVQVVGDRTQSKEAVTRRDGVTIRCDPGVTLNGVGVRRATGVYTYLLIWVKHDDTIVEGCEFTNSWRAVRVSGADDVTLRDLHIHHIGRTGIEVQEDEPDGGRTPERTRIERVRIHDTGLDDGTNWEAIYIGSARSGNSWDGPDTTSNGFVLDSVLGPNIAEGVDIKDDAFGWLIAGNECTGLGETGTGCFNVRGDDNRFERNWAHHNDGSGFRFGGTAAAEGNVLRDNRSDHNGEYGFKFIDWPQDYDATNTGTGNVKGLTTGLP